MKSGRLINTNNIGWIVIILAMIILYFSYFFVYVPSQENKIQQRAFRVLKEYGNNMQEKFDHYDGHLENYGYFYYLKQEYGPGLDTVLKKAVAGSDLDSAQIAKEIKNITSVVDGLESSIALKIEKQVSGQQNDAGQYTEVSLLAGTYNLTSRVKNQPAGEMDSENSDESDLGNPNTSFVVFDENTQQYIIEFHEQGDNLLKKIQGSSGIRKAIRQLGSELSGSIVVEKLPVSTLMDGLKFDRLLQNIILFDEKEVAYNYQSGLVQDITNPLAISDSVSRSQGGLFQEVVVRGEKKYMMVIPLKFLGHQFYLSGYIPEGDYYKKTRAIDNQLLIIIGSLLLLILIGIPVLKVIFINRYERLNAFDATNATISTFLAVGIFLLICTASLKYTIVDKSESINRITRISKGLIGHVNDDLDDIFRIYLGLTGQQRQPSELVNEAENALQQTIETYTQADSTLLMTHFPINEILLADKDGNIVRAYTSTPFSDIVTINLAQRNYFKQVSKPGSGWYISNRLNMLDTTNPDYEARFFIESIKSYNSGKLEAAISFHVDTGLFASTGPEPSVLAITSHIPSLYEQALPEDIQFLVVDQGGEVLFHSTTNKNLHENFLDECEHNPEIIGAIKHRMEAITDIRYNEKSWLARVVPMDDIPLYHITLLDKSQIQDKNARIFLFAFYFLIFTLICIVIGMQVIQRAHPGKRFIPIKNWSFSWLYFCQDLYFKYRTLLFLQLIILLFQVFGFLFIEKPVIMLVYQLMFIGYSAFAAFVMLRKKEHPVWRFFRVENMDSSLMMVFLVLIAVTLIMLEAGIVVVLMAVIPPLFITDFLLYAKKRAETDPDDQSKIAGMFVRYFFSSRSSSHTPVKQTASGRYSAVFIRNVYHAYMFVWMIGLVIVPVMQYYRSIKLQETELWKIHQYDFMAGENLQLINKYKFEQFDILNAPWFKRILGDRLLSFDPQAFEKNSPRIDSPVLAPADTLYMNLPDPLTRENHLSMLLRDKSFYPEWWNTDTSFVFSKAGVKGQINLKKNSGPDPDQLPWWKWLSFMFIPIMVIALFIWILYRFLADNILNTIRAKWVQPEIPGWKVILSDTSQQRILLNALYDDEFLADAQSKFGHPKEHSKQPGLEIIYAGDLVREKAVINYDLLNHAGLVWITGFNDMIRQIDQHGRLLQQLTDIIQRCKARMVISVPFELAYINELYDEYIEVGETEKKEQATIHLLRQQWTTIFRAFYKYTGSMDATMFKGDPKNKKRNQNYSDEKIYGLQSSLESHYVYIWNCLCSAEKLILYDLADDGMLNLKNKYMINRLVMKGLIKYDPYPRLFAETFQYYLRFSVKPEETSYLEQKVGKKGTWRNMRYLILLLLIPLAGFVLIAQGTSIDKVIGIFAGVLALISGLVRLLDSGAFRSASS